MANIAAIPQFTAENIVKKLRLIALVDVAARSSQQVSYSEIAQALAVPESEAELWVIDGERCFVYRVHTC